MNFLSQDPIELALFGTLQQELCRRPFEHVLNLTRLELMRRRRGQTGETSNLPLFTAVAQYETSR